VRGFLNSNVLAALDQLSAALGANDQQAIASSLFTLGQRTSICQNLMETSERRTNQLETTTQNIVSLTSTLKVFKLQPAGRAISKTP
jgi:hypothetical protein